MQLCYTPVLLAFASLSFAQPTDNAKLAKRQTPPPYNGALASWVSAETGIAQGRLLANISPSGGAPGSVAAATSRSNPDYFYHWVRDAGITLREVSIWLNSTSDANTAAIYNQKFQEYTAFSLKIQAAPNPYGLGLAKYNMDGTPYTGPWCNYQSDSAAARALSFIGYARRLLAKGSDISAYYDGKYPSSSVIKADLEYVANSWNVDNKGCDIWEEVRGNHFYTRMIQRRALVEGAQLAAQLGDAGAASWYSSQAAAITKAMDNFWSSSLNRIVTTIDYSGGVNYKTSNLDAQIFLAALHAGLDDGFYTVESDRMLATVVATINTFQPIYGINSATSTNIGSTAVPIGIAIGRYPEDKYNGVDSNGPGNPWSLITSGMAEYHYRLVEVWSARGTVTVTQPVADFLNQLKSKYNIVFKNGYSVGSKYAKGSATFDEILANVMVGGDMYMARVARHTDSNGQMREEWNLNTGYGSGAQDLTWSYEAHTAAARHRAAASTIVYGV